MFCRFCGKQIQDDSDFCAYCGKAQTSNINPNSVPALQNHKNKLSMDMHTLSLISSIVFYLGVIAFLILYIKMAPGVGGTATWTYIIGAAFVIFLAVVVHKIRGKRYTKKRQLVALLFGLALLIPAVGLRIMYEIKVDSVVANVPQTGIVHLDIRMDEDFYSYFQSGYVLEPSSSMLVEGKLYENASVITVDLNKPYAIRINAGYQGEQGFINSSNHGHINRNITFTSENIRNGYLLREKIAMIGGYAEVTIKFARICSFWEVILS